MKRSNHVLAAFVGAAAMTLLLTLDASAHVSIEPPTAQRGSFATFVFRVPNESATAVTNKLRVQMPPDHPMTSVQVLPVPGWTVSFERQAPASAEGNQVETVSVITWEGGRIEPGQYQNFEVTVGPLPDTGDVLYFPAIQSYDDGTESTWIERPSADGTEPELPAPKLELVSNATAGSRDEHGEAIDAASTNGTASSTEIAAPSSGDGDSSNATTIASISLGVAIVSLIAAVVSTFLLVRSRRTA